jgi:undecaprenyl-diphosphatase
MDTLRLLDAAALQLIGQLVASGAVPNAADLALARLLEADFVKIGPLVLMLFHTWLRHGAGAARGILASPERVLRDTGGILGALALGRLLQERLPMSARPRTLPDQLFPPLRDDLYGDMWNWSSMPSDHAALVGALATAIWFSSRRLGPLAMVLAVVVVCLPRIYFGLHSASDVVVGLAIGVGVVAAARLAPAPAAAWNWLARLDARAPALMVLALLVMGWEVIELFDTARLLVGGVVKVALARGGS